MKYIIVVDELDDIISVESETTPTSVDGVSISYSEQLTFYTCDEHRDQILSQYAPDGENIVMVGIGENTDTTITCSICGSQATTKIVIYKK